MEFELSLVIDSETSLKPGEIAMTRLDLGMLVILKCRASANQQDVSHST